MRWLPPDLLLAGPRLDRVAELEETDDDPLSRLSAACGPDAAPLGADALERVRRDASRLREEVSAGAFTRVRRASAVVYQIQAGGHRQTGVVVEVPVEHYRDRRVRRHEATQPERERQLADFLSAAELELVPVMLTHATRPSLQALLDEVTIGQPVVRLVSADSVTQTAWVAPTPEVTRAIWRELAEVDVLYIADGHHRMAAADRHATGAGRLGEPGACDVALGALFPAAEMRLFGYHRCVARPDGVSVPDLLAAVAAQPVTDRIEEYADAEVVEASPGVVPMRLDGRWYRVGVRTQDRDVDARAALDVVAVEEGVIGPALGVADVATDPRVTRLPGTAGVAGTAAVADWCDRNQAVGFLLHPPSIEQVMAVSDTGQVLPAKSTWFDPKARAGPFLRDLTAAEPGA